VVVRGGSFAAVGHTPTASGVAARTAWHCSAHALALGARVPSPGGMVIPRHRAKRW